MLVQEKIVDNESTFGSPVSRFVPDGNIGEGPQFAHAVEAGENHWAMTEGLSDSAPGEIPLVFENPAKATWPPVWNPDAQGTGVRGRSWSKGVIIGMNDSSVSLRPLETMKGTAVPLKKVHGKDLFEAAIDPTAFPTGEILDIEEK